MDKQVNVSHKFDLRGLKVGDSFIGCKPCAFRLDPKTATKREMPTLRRPDGHLRRHEGRHRKAMISRIDSTTPPPSVESDDDEDDDDDDDGFVLQICCNCGVEHKMTKALYEYRLKDHDEFYCPNGHSQHFMTKQEIYDRDHPKEKPTPSPKPAKKPSWIGRILRRSLPVLLLLILVGCHDSSRFGPQRGMNTFIVQQKVYTPESHLYSESYTLIGATELGLGVRCRVSLQDYVDAKVGDKVTVPMP